MPVIQGSCPIDKTSFNLEVDEALAKLNEVGLFAELASTGGLKTITKTVDSISPSFFIQIHLAVRVVHTRHSRHDANG